MKIKLLLFAFTIFAGSASAQTIFYSNNAEVFVGNGAVVQINGGAFLDNATVFTNSANATVTVASNPDPGTFVINGGSIVKGDGTYRVEQDWVNNAYFIGNGSTVELFGNREQFITGTNVTKFHNLTLTGNGSSQDRIKSQTLDAYVDSTGVLALNNRELATGLFTMTVMNPQASSITNNTVTGDEGFVSSVGAGRLVWNTNAAGPYLFPVGSSDGTLRYRPVALERLSGSNTFAVRMANVDANTESRSRSQIEQFSFCSDSKLNDKYFHYVNRKAGSSQGDISIFHDQSADGSFLGMAQWITDKGKWKDMDHVKDGSPAASLSSMKRGGWSDFSNDAFILTNCEGLYVPNVFTPNNDGSNDVLYIRSEGIDQIHIQIWDRWGLKVFEASDPEVAWDGRSMAGIPASDGTYYYILKAKSATTEYPEMTGYITLVK